MRYSKTRKRRAKGTGQLVQNPTFYPLIEPRDDDVIYRPKYGERLDKLAAEYYGNPSYWWIIYQANKDLIFKGERILQPYSFETNPNFSLRIPQNLQQILIKFDDVNRGY